MSDIINVLECFAPVFSARVWQNAEVGVLKTGLEKLNGAVKNPDFSASET